MYVTVVFIFVCTAVQLVTVAPRSRKICCLNICGSLNSSSNSMMCNDMDNYTISETKCMRSYSTHSSKSSIIHPLFQEFDTFIVLSLQVANGHLAISKEAHNSSSSLHSYFHSER